MQVTGNKELRALVGKVSPLWVHSVSRLRIQPRFQNAFIVANTVRARWTHDSFTIPVEYTCRVMAAGVQPADATTKAMAGVLTLV